MSLTLSNLPSVYHQLITSFLTSSEKWVVGKRVCKAFSPTGFALVADGMKREYDDISRRGYAMFRDLYRTFSKLLLAVYDSSIPSLNRPGFDALYTATNGVVEYDVRKRLFVCVFPGGTALPANVLGHNPLPRVGFCTALTLAIREILATHLESYEKICKYLYRIGGLHAPPPRLPIDENGIDIGTWDNHSALNPSLSNTWNTYYNLFAEPSLTDDIDYSVITSLLTDWKGFIKSECICSLPYTERFNFLAFGNQELNDFMLLMVTNQAYYSMGDLPLSPFIEREMPQNPDCEYSFKVYEHPQTQKYCTSVSFNRMCAHLVSELGWKLRHMASDAISFSREFCLRLDSFAVRCAMEYCTKHKNRQFDSHELLPHIGICKSTTNELEDCGNLFDCLDTTGENEHKDYDWIGEGPEPLVGFRSYRHLRGYGLAHLHHPFDRACVIESSDPASTHPRGCLFDQECRNCIEKYIETGEAPKKHYKLMLAAERKACNKMIRSGRVCERKRAREGLGEGQGGRDKVKKMKEESESESESD